MLDDNRITAREIREMVRERDVQILNALDAPPEPEPTTLPTDSAERKALPLFSGVVRYFPAALAAVAKVSKFGNDKHNGVGSELRHTRGKSMDHADCILRHLIDVQERPIDADGMPEVAFLAWRALALCQQWLEDNADAPMAPGATND